MLAVVVTYKLKIFCTICTFSRCDIQLAKAVLFCSVKKNLLKIRDTNLV